MDQPPMITALKSAQNFLYYYSNWGEYSWTSLFQYYSINSACSSVPYITLITYSSRRNGCGTSKGT